MESKKLIVYGASWCGDCIRAKFILDKYNIEYNYIDIDQDENGEKFVLETNKGMRSIPVIVFPDNSTLTEPNNSELLKKLGIES